MAGINCGRCNREVLGQAEFLDECRRAGLHVDAQGRVNLRVGGLAGALSSVERTMEAQRVQQQTTHDLLESRKGFRCSGCAAAFCTDCLFNHAPAHPQGGKACPKCGGRFQYL